MWGVGVIFGAILHNLVRKKLNLFSTILYGSIIQLSFSIIFLIDQNTFLVAIMQFVMGITSAINSLTLETYISSKFKKSPLNLTGRAPGETAQNSWKSLGPNNVGGRTRAALFDLSDTEKDKVFAGGVSGGLWVHQDIDNSSQVPWSKVNGVPGNLAVTVIVQDKNEHSLMFAGTGESYTTGDVIGNGIYRSTDGGQNWSMVLGTNTNSITL